VKFYLTDDELAELDEAAGQAGLARGAFAAEVTMAATRGRSARISAPLREALVELMSAAGAPVLLPAGIGSAGLAPLPTSR
jgi:hypothetical protein